MSEPEGSMLLAAVVGNLFSNMITFGLIYGFWRLTKDETDMKAIGICLVCFTVAGVSALALRL